MQKTRLIAADKVEGTRVYDLEGNRIGSIENIMIDKLTGKVAYADMSFGGFLGIGERHHPLPWNLLKYNTKIDGYEVAIDRDKLEKAPTFEPDDHPDWEDPSWGQQIHAYYNVTPYWL
ncbi:MAG: PRC-barrel domain containing protein [Alphaproteobacteria bacterium]|nr:PRC-barrel domain containing protein [Alphaproteobacteria bacterium]